VTFLEALQLVQLCVVPAVYGGWRWTRRVDHRLLRIERELHIPPLPPPSTTWR
jgi:hypothetical protein